ncbi:MULTISPECIES: AMP-binding protein [Sphingomonadales]|jgi:propionyl-CoA synthetase|uniref:Propionyl-CoA synthetase n=2 Tax=Sphingomonadales TaxID=204457 RepID=A0A7Y9XXF7_9SPHN|nr:AMP-binding protein [Novosphingobium marinum]MEE1878321.1 AMP-binding protein [Erythrobacteraceae bacterium 1XM1-14]NYH94861.1 propionyl-CoA synthetase [Novosphingobium marinum]GGC36794.1 acyl-CoA synthetase [Novosphingobium marinum]
MSSTGNPSSQGAIRRLERAQQEASENAAEFWGRAAQAIDWFTPPNVAFDDIEGWFPDGKLNTCHNCLDRHVAAGRGGSTALIYDSPVTKTIKRYSYSELLEQTGRVAAMLKNLGVAQGDRVVIYMPMVPETVFAMLACARLGVVHSVVFGGFSPLELAKRIDDATPKLVLTASCGIEGGRTIAYKPLVDEAIALTSHPVQNVVLLQREQVAATLNPYRDIDWMELRTRTIGDEIPPCAPVAATDPLYVLYTSGTTGLPKGVVRENGGNAVALAWSMENIYGIEVGDTFWAASDVGWVVGHSYIVYGPLLVGATTVLFEGKPVGTPDPGTFWRIIARHHVKSFFTAPTAIRAIRKEDPDGRLLGQIGTGRCQAIFLAGERADPDTIDWLEQNSGLPVIDHWWQTELGWPAIATCIGLGDRRRKRGSAGLAVPGYEFAILDDHGKPVAEGDSGNVVIRAPLAPGAFRTLWNNKAGYEKNFATFPGFYETGDAGYRDLDGFLHIMGRTDDIINVAGHRLSTGQMEQIVASQDGVAECAVIGADDPIKGMIPIAFVSARTGHDGDEALASRIVEAVRDELGPLAALKKVHVVPQLPKTRSGKILRNLLRKIVNSEPFEIPPTIEDTSVPAAIATLVEAKSAK